jgi:chloramphenicol 3-O phosphotransferase
LTSRLATVALLSNPQRRKSDHKTSWDDWVVALAGLDVVWVGIRCSAEVAEERNRVRGDRFAGLARAQTATVHQHPRYDFEIDTTTQGPAEAVLELTRRLGI